MNKEQNGYELNQFYDVIDTVASILHNHAKAKGFYDDEPVRTEGIYGTGLNESASRVYLGNKLMLMVTEIAEAHEAIRKKIDKSDHIPEFSALEEEVADIIIRALDFSGYLKLRLGEAIKAKLIFNQSREYKHGKQF